MGVNLIMKFLIQNRVVTFSVCLILCVSGCFSNQTNSRENNRSVEARSEVGVSNVDPFARTPVEYVLTKRGETLSQIARNFTGSGNNWAKIARYNKHLNPHRLKLGQKVFIPGHLLEDKRIAPSSTEPTTTTESIEIAEFNRSSRNIRADKSELTVATRVGMTKFVEEESSQQVSTFEDPVAITPRNTAPGRLASSLGEQKEKVAGQ